GQSPLSSSRQQSHSAHSNSSETQTERGRTLFDLVRKTSESARAYRTDLSRRLRDGVSWENELVSSRTDPAATNPHQSWISLPVQGWRPKNACTTNGFMLN